MVDIFRKPNNNNSTIFNYIHKIHSLHKDRSQLLYTNVQRFLEPETASFDLPNATFVSVDSSQLLPRVFLFPITSPKKLLSVSDIVEICLNTIRIYSNLYSLKMASSAWILFLLCLLTLSIADNYVPSILPFIC